MSLHSVLTRRRLLQGSAVAVSGALVRGAWASAADATSLALPEPLAEFPYASVTLASEPHEAQRRNTYEVLMGIGDDSLLKPFREMVGQPAPGDNIGGWYEYKPDYDYRKDDAGFAPGANFGQWVSALARDYAITGDPATRARVLRLNRLYAATVATAFYEKNRFPAYCFDKLVCGLIDAHTFAHDPDAFAILDRTLKAAAPQLPGRALDRDRQAAWRPGRDLSWTWDESYTLPENLFLAYQRGAGRQYRDMAFQYLDDERYFDPLALGENVLAGRHAYSYVNALGSAMQAYMVGRSGKHLQAAKNAFAMLEAQSFATGGWGPDEQLRAPGSGDLSASLEKTHNSFETPCGAYAHFKLTRYLLRVTRDARYGDSMERVMYNTVLGAKPLEPDGRAFYYADCNFKGERVYSNHRWPCCSGTLPQVAADYRVNGYFRAPDGVYINLYIPSTLRWREAGAELSLTQSGGYPLDAEVAFEVRASRPVEQTLYFRVPAWAEGALLRVNGKRVAPEAVPGTFAAVRRAWKSGDRTELELPLTQRLQAVDAQHPDIVALLRGPLVLFALRHGDLPAISRGQLLAARRSGDRQWEVASPAGRITMTPFTEIGERPYSTYVKAV